MVREDECQEAISRIRMAVDRYDAEQVAKRKEEEDDASADTPAHWSSGRSISSTNTHWSFGSRCPGRKEDSRYLSECFLGDRDFKGFDEKLRTFLIEVFPKENISYESTLLVWSLLNAILSC